MRLFFFIIFYLPYNLFSNERYVCEIKNDNKSTSITNFYIINDKVTMSGAIGNGEYKLINKDTTGLLAINSSFIGENYGLETILINNKNNTIIYKVFIRNKNYENINQIIGKCAYYN